MDVDYSEIRRTLETVAEQGGWGGEAPDFGSLITNLTTAGDSLSAEGLIGYLLDRVWIDWSGYRGVFLQIVGIAMGAAVLKGMTESFRNKQVSETGFFVAYLLLLITLLSGYTMAYRIAEQVMGWVVEFMQGLLPTYALAVAFCTGSTSSLLFYQGALLAIGLVEMVIVGVLLPLTQVYLVLMLIDPFVRENSLSQLGELIRQLILWGARTLFGVVVGIQVVQGMILPASDQVKRSLLYKTAEILPGVGNVIGSVTETVMGTGILVKNAVGVAGLLALIGLCMVPLGKLLLEYLVCKVAAGVCQPVSDKRIVEGMSVAAEASRLLLYLTGTVVLLFALTISLIAVSTGGK